MLKRQLRLSIRERLAALSPADLAERSTAACRRLIDTPEFERAGVIMIFLSLPTEIDTSSLALAAWNRGKRVAAPLVHWEQFTMDPVELQSLGRTAADGPTGLRQPLEGLSIAIEELDLVLAPGLAFDLGGTRLGRGRGFYDRFLSHRDFRGTACGLAFECQVVEALPREPHDRRVDMLVTDEQVRRFSTRSMRA